MPVITISRQYGTGGITLAESVAARLGYDLVDREVVARIAEMANLSINWVEAVERQPGGLLTRLGSIVTRGIIERYLHKAGPDFDHGQYIDFLKRIITDLAAEGDVIIVGRGAQFILPAEEHIFKTLLIADTKDRIAFLTKHHGLNPSEAAKFLRKEDRIRKSFLKRLDPRDPDDPKWYDLVLNLSQISLEEAENMMLHKIFDLVDRITKPIW